MTTASQNDILLETGTNELEILVFVLADQRYGVNVAKVREVINPTDVTRLPETHPAVVGVFQLRDAVTPLIHLKLCLHQTEKADLSDGKIIIMEFNDARVGFFVDTVEQIYRVNWNAVSAIPAADDIQDTPVTSVTQINDTMVLMLDFEKLVFDIGGVDLFAQSAKRIRQNLSRGDQRILLAEDSTVMRTLINSNLNNAGYTNVVTCTDGEEAWAALSDSVSDSGSPGFELLVTDIEMPRIDGLHLTRRVKEDARLKHIPVIIFSSLVSADNQKKCEAVGADAQITKPQLAELVGLIDGLLLAPETVAATQA